MGLLDQIWGNKNLQFFFERLRTLAMKGMNYGRASDYAHNGETEVIRKVASIAGTPSTVLFDVGANKGQFTNHVMDAWMGMAYQLYAFEPSRKTFDILQRSIPLSPFVHFINVGFSDKPGSAELYYDEEGSGLASLYPRDLSHRNIDFTDHETITLTTLDIFCRENSIASIDFLKLDVEGHELAVLKGASQLLEDGKIKIIQFEFGGCNIDSRIFFRDYFAFFNERFRLYRILSNGLRPIDAYSEKLEVFQSANYLAIRKDLV